MRLAALAGIVSAAASIGSVRQLQHAVRKADPKQFQHPGNPSRGETWNKRRTRKWIAKRRATRRMADASRRRNRG